MSGTGVGGSGELLTTLLNSAGAGQAVGSQAQFGLLLQLLQRIVAALEGSITTTGVWTPIDGSGAGLSFTNASGVYTRVGKLCVANAYVTYPVTANGAN